jgi:uridine phosphorylase
VPDFRSILDVDKSEWLLGLGIEPDEIPDCVIVEGSWWRAERQEWRLSHLTDVRELGFPDIYLGRYGDRTIAFCMAYGAPRAVEIITMFAAIGTGLVIQVGTCGGLQPELQPGDIVIPDLVCCEDGVSHLYGADPATTSATPLQIERARAMLQSRGRTVRVGPHVTFSSLFAESVQMMEAWHSKGLLSVDMETATTLSVAEEYGCEAVSLLVVWDELTRGRRFLDPMSVEATAELDQSNGDVFQVALDLAVSGSH